MACVTNDQMFKIRQIYAFWVSSFDHKQRLNINIFFFKLKKRKQPCRKILSEIILKLELKLLKSNISYQQTRSQFAPRNGQRHQPEDVYHICEFQSRNTDLRRSQSKVTVSFTKTFISHQINRAEIKQNGFTARFKDQNRRMR